MANLFQSTPLTPLGELKKLIKKGDYMVEIRAYNSAYMDFGWDPEFQEKALLKLKREHFFKTELRYEGNRPPDFMDVYKAKGLLSGQDVYIHLYKEDDGKIVIDSFKKL